MTRKVVHKNDELRKLSNVLGKLSKELGKLGKFSGIQKGAFYETIKNQRPLY